MKNNKGFTLAELLAIIVLISVFSLLVGPNLTKQIQSSDEEGKNVLSQNIYNASMIYVGKYYADKMVNEKYEDVKFTLEDLIEDGLLDLDGSQCEGDKTDNITVNSDGSLNFDLLNCYEG